MDLSIPRHWRGNQITRKSSTAPDHPWQSVIRSRSLEICLKIAYISI